MKVFQVGGSVRDQLMGVQPKDKDWVVVNSSPEEMEKNGFKPIGKDFPVFLHPETNEEYALARTEKKSGVGYKGFTFYFDSSVTLEQDLERRDFTINAIAKSSDGKIIDPFNGQLDIKNKLFRHTSPAFSEDPLRVLRFARFKTYGHLHDFDVAENTVKFFKKIVASGELGALSSDRVWMETQRALSGDHTKEFFKTVIDYDLKDPWFNELSEIACNGSNPENKWAEMQSVNHFRLCRDLPIPNYMQKITNLLSQILGLLQCNSKQEKIRIIQTLNIPRNSDVLNSILQIQSLSKDKDYLEKIISSILRIDFSILAGLSGSNVLEKKQFLYDEALNKLL